MQELVKIDNISFKFQDQLLFENINASIQVGEIIGVIGKNGGEKLKARLAERFSKNVSLLLLDEPTNHKT